MSSGTPPAWRAAPSGLKRGQPLETTTLEGRAGNKRRAVWWGVLAGFLYQHKVSAKSTTRSKVHCKRRVGDGVWLIPVADDFGLQGVETRKKSISRPSGVAGMQQEDFPVDTTERPARAGTRSG
eukprot:1114851-Amphidinium_carterae.2